MIKNQIKTVILLGALTGLLLAVGRLVGGAQGLTIGLIFAIVMNFFAYWFSDKIVLMMYRAKEIKEKDNPTLFHIVKEVANKAGLPMPKVYIIPSSQSNAFATGRNPEKAAVAVTESIMKLLDKEELKGVIAHEMAHIKNRDTLIQAVAATIAGVISYAAFMARWAAIFGGRNRDSGNLFELLALAIITPLIATIIQLAISRSREYIADETGAKTLKNSLGLASALEKLEKDAKQHPMGFGNASTSSLFIVNPFTAKGFLTLLSTHPAMDERVRRLKNLNF